ncbi:MAG TPA: hypothetical protein VK684_14600 [Edaphobacter sp.]|jgi:hypothetical protein|nr:hypothetical protein [Edaphobacter sp.]
MKAATALRLASLLLCISIFMPERPCHAQDSMAEIARSHIDANVPSPEFFDAYMKRDLSSYLCKGPGSCRIEYQLLRDGPTQTGISYPKFYVWAKCFNGDRLQTEGAARLAAIDKKEFQITNFLSRSQISDSPQQVGEIFPAPLVKNILQRAKQ